MSDVFISYKAEEYDEANWVRKILEHNGISCWMAPTSISGGSSYAVEIPKAIKECKVLVLILTERAQTSKWVPRELDQAINENKVIMPFALDNSALKDDFNFYLSNVQRYAAYENKAAAMEKMINEIRAIIGAAKDKEEAPQNEIPVNVPPVVQTEATPPAKKQSLLKPLLIIGGILFAIIALIVILIAVGTGNDDNKTDAPSHKETSTAITENAVMSDELFDFTFTLEGTVYKLPCSYEQLTNNGWTISSSGYSGDTKIAGNSYEFFNMAKEGKSISVCSYNMSGNVKTVKECLIGGIACDGYHEIDFEIAKGITVSSTAEEVKNAFGIPGNSSSGQDYESMTYFVEKDSYQNSVRFYCANDSKYSSIDMKNFVETDNDKTETNTDKPEYLSGYKKPSSNGADIKSTVVEIEGVLYQLPAPVSEFLDNGWEITQRGGDVVAGGTDSIQIEKDGKKLSMSIINYAEYQTTTENCAVYAVYADSYGEVPSVTIGPKEGGISMGMEKSAVEAAVTDDFEYTEGTYSYTYSYYEYKERDFSISVYVNKETNKVSTIDISCRTLDY